MPWKYHVWGAMHEAILKPSSKAQNSFWIKSHTGEDMGQFYTDTINKAVQSFRQSNKSTWRVMEDILSFFSIQKMFTLTVFALSWRIKLISDNVSTAKLPWLKAA